MHENAFLLSDLAGTPGAVEDGLTVVRRAVFDRVAGDLGLEVKNIIAIQPRGNQLLVETRGGCPQLVASESISLDAIRKATL